MHMSDALLSPAVGGVMLATSGSILGIAAKKGLTPEQEQKSVPMMGVMGAFIFAAQMVNFTIPGTGSSGHITGGILLSALLGPVQALITMASVLLIQALFFADGGLLAYGANLFNLGVIPCLLVYPLLYRPLVGRLGLRPKGITVASIFSVVVSAQLGALAVVLQTILSGGTALSFGSFLLFMQPIHLAIGLAEGVITASLLCFVLRTRPALLEVLPEGDAVYTATFPSPKRRLLPTVALVLLLTLVTAGGLSLFASTLPDGLEWSLEQAVSTPLPERESVLHDASGKLVDGTAVLPDYAFPTQEEEEPASPAGTATAGLLGSFLTVLLASGVGAIILLLRRRKQRKTAP